MATIYRTCHEGNTRVLRPTLTDKETGDPIDLTGATVTVSIPGLGIEAAAVNIDDDEGGVVSYQIGTGVAIEGRYPVIFDILVDGEASTVPDVDDFILIVRRKPA